MAFFILRSCALSPPPLQGTLLLPGTAILAAAVDEMTAAAPGHRTPDPVVSQRTELCHVNHVPPGTPDGGEATADLANPVQGLLLPVLLQHLLPESEIVKT